MRDAALNRTLFGPALLAPAVALAGPLAPLDQTFQLSSYPAATKTIYLDFTGHVTSGTSWENGATISTPVFDPADNGPPLLPWELERIQYIWQRVSEDYSPFDVNVTTRPPTPDDLARSGAGDSRWGIRVVIGDNNWTNPAGGLALFGTFTADSDTPCFVFENGLGNGNEKWVADAISHEVGHTLGLSHDGRTSPAEGYYGGHGAGSTAWGPIMGAPYGVNLTQWSRGQYLSADQKEDDLVILTTRNGFGYRADDHGNSRFSATPLTISLGKVAAAGVISTPLDRDVFGFEHAGGPVSLRADPFDRGPNLDIGLELLDALGNLLAASSPADDLYAELAYDLPPGTYYLRVDGVGRGDPLGTGYADYGSLGQFWITGLVPEPASMTVISALALATLRRRRTR